MAKGGKKTPASTAGMKPITTFFPRKPKTTASTPQPSSSPAALPLAPSKGIFSSPPRPSDGSLTNSLRRSTRLSEEPSSSTKNLKMHPQSPPLSLPVSPPSRSQAKRKAKFDSDSDEERSSLPEVVYVKRTHLSPLPDESPTNFLHPLGDNERINTPESAHKKPRLSVDLILENPLLEKVQSSQSTEGLSPLASISSRPATPVSDNRDNEACSPPLSAERNEALTPPAIEHSLGSAFDIPTPPLTDAASDDFGYPAPPSPVAVDSATKTAKLIADIRAQAFAKFSSSPEQAPLRDLSDIEDDSDDDLPSLSLHDVKPTDEKGKSKDKEASPVLAANACSRYSLRNRTALSPAKNGGPSAVRNTPKRIRSPFRSPSKYKPREKVSVKKTSFNPLDELLKEKRLADQRGKGEEALIIAEHAALNLARGALLDEMDDEEDIFKPFTATGNELSTTTSFDSMDFPTEVISLAEEDRKRLFGEGGKDIVNILRSDMENKAKERANQKVFGISLWRNSHPCTEDEMKVDFDPPTMSTSFVSAHPILQILNSAVQARDYTIAGPLLESGALSTFELAGNPSIINYLFELAFSLNDRGLTLPTYHALTHIWSQSYPCASPSFSALLQVFVHLGANSGILKALGWEAEFIVPHQSWTREQREDNLYRLVRCLSLSATHVKHEEIPDIVSALLLIAMDSTSSSELRQEIIVTVDSICTSVSPEAEILTQIESTVVNKGLMISELYEPVNKANLVSVLAGGSTRTRRIAQWIASCIIVGQTKVSPNEYSELPSLQKLLEQLTNRTTHEISQSKFALHEHTDYVDMGFYVHILGVALSNVKGYVEQETSLKKRTSQQLGSPTKSVEKFETDLQLVRKALETIHGRISDTRAAHLERSRTKSAIKALSMRLYYQREAFLRNSRLGNGGKPRPNLHLYFSPKHTKQ